MTCGTQCSCADNISRLKWVCIVQHLQESHGAIHKCRLFVSTYVHCLFPAWELLYDLKITKLYGELDIITRASVGCHWKPLLPLIERMARYPISTSGKILGQIGISRVGRVTSLTEGKPLNSKPEECCSEESMAHWCTILLLPAHLRSVVGSTQILTTINKLPV